MTNIQPKKNKTKVQSNVRSARKLSANNFPSYQTFRASRAFPTTAATAILSWVEESTEKKIAPQLYCMHTSRSISREFKKNTSLKPPIQTASWLSKLDDRSTKPSCGGRNKFWYLHAVPEGVGSCGLEFSLIHRNSGFFFVHFRLENCMHKCDMSEIRVICRDKCKTRYNILSLSFIEYTQLPMFA